MCWETVVTLQNILVGYGSGDKSSRLVNCVCLCKKEFSVQLWCSGKTLIIHQGTTVSGIQRISRLVKAMFVHKCHCITLLLLIEVDTSIITVRPWWHHILHIEMLDIGKGELTLRRTFHSLEGNSDKFHLAQGDKVILFVYILSLPLEHWHILLKFNCSIGMGDSLDDWLTREGSVFGSISPAAEAVHVFQNSSVHIGKVFP